MRRSAQSSSGRRTERCGSPHCVSLSSLVSYPPPSSLFQAFGLVDDLAVYITERALVYCLPVSRRILHPCTSESPAPPLRSSPTRPRGSAPAVLPPVDRAPATQRRNRPRISIRIRDQSRPKRGRPPPAAHTLPFFCLPHYPARPVLSFLSLCTFAVYSRIRIGGHLSLAFPVSHHTQSQSQSNI